MTSVCSRGRALAARSRRARAGTSHVGLLGGRVGRLGPPGGAHPRAGRHERGGGEQREEDPPLDADRRGRARRRRACRTAARRSARAPSRRRPRRRSRRRPAGGRPGAATAPRRGRAPPSATSRIAASTQVKTCSAERESVTAVPPWKYETWYQGRSSETRARPPRRRSCGTPAAASAASPERLTDRRPRPARARIAVEQDVRRRARRSCAAGPGRRASSARPATCGCARGRP